MWMLFQRTSPLISVVYQTQATEIPPFHRTVTAILVSLFRMWSFKVKWDINSALQLARNMSTFFIHKKQTLLVVNTVKKKNSSSCSFSINFPFNLQFVHTYIDFEVPSDTKAAILFLKSVVPLSKFEGKIPAIILKHQIYCVVKDKTLVDRQLVS